MNGKDRERVQRLLEDSSDPENPTPDEILEILQEVEQIAVVGMSRDPMKAARRVPSFLLAKGYEILPVNPHADRILGRRAYDHLDEIEDPVDLVLVFRPSDEAGEVVAAAAARPEHPVIWLQEGIRADEAVDEARGKGLTVVQDLCMFKAYRDVGDSIRGHFEESPRDGEAPYPQYGRV